ncbi:MAG: arsenic efflux protein [Firmicutes bacterium]|nr:arsenic efflux protein [Bacillota bacterium]
MKEIILDTLIDSLKLIPFLLVAFLLLEYIEHKMNKKTEKMIQKSGKFGPFIGGILGIFPQCGFSVMATNLYGARIITIGTLISIYLTTSDEMLPILISKNVEISVILKIILVKLLVGITVGFICNLILKKSKNDIEAFCNEEHCDCNHSIFKSSLKHTINILLFILVFSFILNTLIYYIGEDKLSSLFTQNIFLGPIISSLIGLIPNCASSVIITELYLDSIISAGSMLSGLLTGSGIALLILFKINDNLKENIKILSIIYLVGVVTGIIMNLFNVIF